LSVIREKELVQGKRKKIRKTIGQKLNVIETVERKESWQEEERLDSLRASQSTRKFPSTSTKQELNSNSSLKERDIQEEKA